MKRHKGTARHGNGEQAPVRQHASRIQVLVDQARRLGGDSTLDMQRLLVKMQLCAEAILGNNRAIAMLIQNDVAT